ncbi:hypothetical protein [Streptomyces sp. PTY087I2]|uniref:hypothetical protein n=1 Tax=Streptomyces sp. PTY087I2 TaxID=1819298 RepID=UPI0008293CBC|nr:hypothetical protein [Streptomyces sp. PTY087I2]OCC07323.1 hypothetical protein A3Q37_06873 [Streptomyces sp. PTY087I2]
MRRQAHEVMVNGTPMVAVPAKDLDGLLATRRQLGSQNARMHRMRDVLTEAAEFLDALADALADDLDGAVPPGGTAAGPQRSPLPRPGDRSELTASIRERAERMRAVTGRPRSAGAPAPRSAS